MTGVCATFEAHVRHVEQSIIILAGRRSRVSLTRAAASSPRPTQLPRPSRIPFVF